MSRGFQAAESTLQELQYDRRDAVVKDDGRMHQERQDGCIKRVTSATNSNDYMHTYIKGE